MKKAALIAGAAFQVTVWRVSAQGVVRLLMAVSAQGLLDPDQPVVLCQPVSERQATGLESVRNCVATARWQMVHASRQSGAHPLVSGRGAHIHSAQSVRSSVPDSG